MTKKGKNINIYSIRYKNSMKPIDWTYYTKFYPEKAKAIYALRFDTGLDLTDAKDVVEEIFTRLERGEAEQRESNAECKIKNYSNRALFPRNGELKKMGKGALIIGGLTTYMGLGAIAKLTSKYMKKK